MKYLRMLCALIIILDHAPAHALSESDKIRALLEALGSSKLVFIRNNTEYSSEKARTHLEMKLSRAGSRIRTAEDFIRYLATKSSATGESYYIRLSDGTKVESAEWLRRVLREIEKTE